MADISCIKVEKLPSSTQCWANSIRYSIPLALSSGWARLRINQQKLKAVLLKLLKNCVILGARFLLSFLDQALVINSLFVQKNNGHVISMCYIHLFNLHVV